MPRIPTICFYCSSGTHCLVPLSLWGASLRWVLLKPWDALGLRSSSPSSGTLQMLRNTPDTWQTGRKVSMGTGAFVYRTEPLLYVTPAEHRYCREHRVMWLWLCVSLWDPKVICFQQVGKFSNSLPEWTCLCVSQNTLKSCKIQNECTFTSLIET